MTPLELEAPPLAVVPSPVAVAAAPPSVVAAAAAAAAAAADALSFLSRARRVLDMFFTVAAILFSTCAALITSSARAMARRPCCMTVVSPRPRHWFTTAARTSSTKGPPSWFPLRSPLLPPSPRKFPRPPPLAAVLASVSLLRMSIADISSRGTFVFFFFFFSGSSASTASVPP